MLTAQLPLLPQDAREINDSLAILDDGERYCQELCTEFLS